MARIFLSCSLILSTGQRRRSCAVAAEPFEGSAVRNKMKIADPFAFISAAGYLV